MDKAEIQEFIAGREEDIDDWRRDNEEDRKLLERLPKVIADRERWIAASRARIVAMAQRMENDKWNEVSR